MIMTVSQFVAAALDLSPSDRPVDRIGRARRPTGGRCWLCGGLAAGDTAWRQADAIGSTFTQHNCAVLPDSDAVCAACVAVTRAEMFQSLVRRRGLPIKLWSQAGWHSYSHLVTGAGAYEAPVPSRLRDILLDPPEPPFVLGLNPSGKKHTLFRSRVATSRDLFPVHFDERTFLVDRRRLTDVLSDLETMSALGISKEQIASGNYHSENLRRAGLLAWRTGELRMRIWRSTQPDLLALAAWVGRGSKWFADHGQAEATG